MHVFYVLLTIVHLQLNHHLSNDGHIYICLVKYDFLNNHIKFQEHRPLFDKKENRIKVAGDVKIFINEKGEINAQQITIHIDKKGNIEIVEAYKDVEILLNSTQQKITSNEAKFDNKNLQINLLGDVTLKQGKNFLKGDSAFLDLDKGTSKILSTTTNSVKGVFY